MANGFPESKIFVCNTSQIYCRVVDFKKRNTYIQGVQDGLGTFSIILMLEKCVHFDTWNKKNFPYDLAHFKNFQPNPIFKNEQNHREEGPFEKMKYSKYQSVHIFPS